MTPEERQEAYEKAQAAAVDEMEELEREDLRIRQRVRVIRQRTRVIRRNVERLNRYITEQSKEEKP